MNLWHECLIAYKFFSVYMSPLLFFGFGFNGILPFVPHKCYDSVMRYSIKVFKLDMSPNNVFYSWGQYKCGTPERLSSSERELNTTLQNKILIITKSRVRLSFYIFF
jgi:hypothetical protein